jgi:ATP-binding cassette, subfamily B (MDR/TAP), member 1
MTRALGSVIFGLYSCWKLGLTLASVLPISIFFFVLTVFLSKKYTIEENRLNGVAAKIFRVVIGSIRTVLVFGGEYKEIENYDKALHNAELVTLKKGLILGFTSGLSSFFNYASYAIWIGYGTYLFRNECQTFTAGNIIQTFSAFIISALAVAQAFPFVKELGEAKLACSNLFEALNLRVETNIFDTSQGATLPADSVRGKLEFQNVKFAYSSRPDKNVINDMSLKVGAGQTVAIIGKSGCGKTTIIKNLARLFEITSGKV